MPTHVYDGISRLRMATTRSIARVPSRSDASASSTFARTACSVSVAMSVLQLAEQQQQSAEERYHLQSRRRRVQPAEGHASRIAFGKTRGGSADLCLHLRNLRRHDQP